MPLVECVDCGKQISTHAPACPNCGCPKENQTGEEVLPEVNVISVEANIKRVLYEDLEYRGGVMWKKEWPFTGLATSWYENGNKELETNYKDGKEAGLYTEWYADGRKKSEGNYKDGKLDGLWTAWYADGQKKSEGNSKDGKMYGLWTEWYENGQRKREANYKDGKLMSAVSWKPNGEKCPVTNVKDGNGGWVGYYKEGQKESEASWSDGKLMSAVVWKPENSKSWWHKFLHISQKCPVTNVKNGNGVVVMYNKDGTELGRTTYRDGKLIED
jgi:antitoxin component YwqK of YwqJK toxin-antitoxin module